MLPWFLEMVCQKKAAAGIVVEIENLQWTTATLLIV